MELNLMKPSEANLVLERRLREFKELKGAKPEAVIDYDPLADQTGKINNLLYDAIYFFPTEVNAVKLSAKISFSDDNDRSALSGFLEAVSEQGLFDSLNNVDFVLNLPYNKSTGVVANSYSAVADGESKVRAGEGSFEVIKAVLINDTPCFTIEPSSDGSCERVKLLAEEVKSIELVKAGIEDFTPYVKQNQEGGFEIVGKRSPAAHYLIYRGFQGFCGLNKKIPEIPFKEEIGKVLNQIYLPSDETGLFKSDNSLINGFAVYSLFERPVMYKFNNYEVHDALASTDDAVKAACGILLDGYAINYGCVENCGCDEIIDELSQFKPATL